MYTRLLRKFIEKMNEMSGHCDSGGGSGHCG